mgnify:CR=1 FL=1
MSPAAPAPGASDSAAGASPEIKLPPAKAKQADAELERIAAALSSLTPHQFRVLMMLGEGLLNKQIAYHLGVSEATIKAHVTAILRKMNVNNRTQAVLAVQRLQINSPAMLDVFRDKLRKQKMSIEMIEADV